MKKKVDLSHLKDDWDFYDDLIMKLGLEEDLMWRNDPKEIVIKIKADD